MNRKKFSYFLSAVLLITLIAGGLLCFRKFNYVAVTVDTSNVCGYSDDGKLISSTTAIERKEIVYVRKSRLDEYIKEATASNKCISY